jgi:pimeloyl-ACP methyl ester carboxylesterase
MKDTPTLTAGELRALSELIILATVGVTDVIQEAHRELSKLPGPLRPLQPILSLIPDGVYASIRGITKLVGATIDTALSLIPSELGIVPGSAAPSSAREAALAVLNGIVGDTLVAKGNALAIPMTFRSSGLALSLEQDALRSTFPKASAKIVILVHGSCMNDLQWQQGEFNYGKTLAEDGARCALYLHYNTGLAVAENGAALASLLETLRVKWPVPILEITFVAHSMGGLVVRSACESARIKKLEWLSKLHAGILLGTPHHGAPLERLGQLVDVSLGAVSYTKAFARLGKIRSAGVTDLADGAVLAATKDPSARTWVPLPPHAAWFIVAAMMSQAPEADEASTTARKVAFVGDGLVPRGSALGLGETEADSLKDCTRWTGYAMNHVDLLRCAPLQEALHSWLHGVAAPSTL